MSWGIKQTSAFSRVYRRLDNKLTEAVDDAISVVAENPNIGTKKKGDLAQLYVYKFSYKTLIYLLGYELDGHLRLIYLESVGPHENCYRDLSANK